MNGENADPLFAWLAAEKPFEGFGKGLKMAALKKFSDMNNKQFGEKAYIGKIVNFGSAALMNST